MGNEDTTIGSTLHGTEDTGTSGSAGKTNIKEGLEGAALAIIGLGGLGESELAVSLLNTSEVLIEAELLQDTAGDKEAGSISSRPVGKTVLNAVGLELVGVGRDEDLVTSDLGAHDLHDDVAVGEANHYKGVSGYFEIVRELMLLTQSVLGAGILGLVLGDQPATGKIVSQSVIKI